MVLTFYYKAPKGMSELFSSASQMVHSEVEMFLISTNIITLLIMEQKFSKQDECASQQMDQNLMFNYVCRGEVSSSSIYFSAQWTSVFHIEVVQASDFHVLIEEFVENASTCGRVGIGNERK